MTDQPRPVPEQDSETGRFVSGNIGGPGRGKGSRNKLGEAFIADLYEDWWENGSAAIKVVRAEKPDAYLKVIASILPKDVNLNVNQLDQMSEDELIARIRQLDALVRPFLDSEGVRGTRGGTEAASIN